MTKTSIQMPTIVIGLIATSGVFLLAATLVLCFLVYHDTQETVKNRQIGCISRALDHQAYAPQCKEYVNG